jgi:enamine deaminase RidA (YjgF/YER057c/UK114 family)
MADAHPYSLAFEKDGVVYISGAVGLDADGVAVTGDRAALDAALDAVERRLQSVGLDLSNVVKTTYFADDVALRDHANAQYEDRFSEPRPARTFVVVADLPYDARVAIEAIAHR